MQVQRPLWLPLDANKLLLAHVGDSRAYLIRQGKIYQLTQDHTKGYFALKNKKLSPEEIARWSKKNDLEIFVGKERDIAVDTNINFSGQSVICF